METITLQNIEHDNDADFMEQKRAEYTELEKLGPFIGKRVEIEYTQRADFMGHAGTLTGRFQKLPDGRLFFLPKGKRRSGFNVTAGLFEGFFATIVIRKVTLL